MFGQLAQHPLTLVKGNPSQGSNHLRGYFRAGVSAEKPETSSQFIIQCSIRKRECALQCLFLGKPLELSDELINRVVREVAEPSRNEPDRKGKSTTSVDDPINGLLISATGPSDDFSE
jgi:hypothetical protein